MRLKADRHDAHHSRPHAGNYGSFFCLWDVLLGTHCEIEIDGAIVAKQEAEVAGDGSGASTGDDGKSVDGGAAGACVATAASPKRRVCAGLLLVIMWGGVAVALDNVRGRGAFYNSALVAVVLNSGFAVGSLALPLTLDPKGTRMAALLRAIDPVPSAWARPAPAAFTGTTKKEQ